MQNQRKQNESGFTLLELLIVITILSIVMSVALGLLVTLMHNESQQSARADAQNELNFALEQLSADLREANPVYAPSSPSAKLYETNLAIGPSAGTQTFIRWSIDGGHLVRSTLDSPGGTETGQTIALDVAQNAATSTPLFRWFTNDGSELVETDASSTVTCSVRAHIALQSGLLNPDKPLLAEADVAIRNATSNAGSSC